MNRLLICDPELAEACLWKEWLERNDLWVAVAPDTETALHALQKHHFAVCLWAVSGLDAIQAFDLTRQKFPTTAFVVVCRSSATQEVTAFMRAGASDYWVRNDTDSSELVHIVDKTLRRVAALSPSQGFESLNIPEFVGRDPKMIEVFGLIQSIKDTDSTVLITGESGTGKEVVARAIHNLSPRRKQPWVAVNCGAIPATLLESELFGHVKGAFTGATQNRLGRFQLAGNGSLFLDEISDLPFDLQAKLLRAIQNRVFDPVGSSYSATLEARIIAATNQDLETAVAERRFREDLFYRLNVIPIFLPPLRSRKGDIPLLANFFLKKFTATYQRPSTGIGEEAMRVLTQYHWPGNVRELENFMERIVILKRDVGTIELKDFPLGYFKNIRLDRFVSNISLPEEGLDFNDAVNDFENALILQALQKTAGNKNKAATLLNLNRTTLVEKLKRKGIRVT